MMEKEYVIEGYWRVSGFVPTTTGTSLMLGVDIQASDEKDAEVKAIQYFIERQIADEDDDYSMGDYEIWGVTRSVVYVVNLPNISNVPLLVESGVS